MSRSKNGWNYFVMILVMMNSLHVTNPVTSTPQFLIFSVLILLIIARKRKVPLFTKSLFNISMFLLILFSMYIVKYMEMDKLFMFSTYTRIFLAYVSLKILGKSNFLYYLKEIVYYGAIISLPLYVLQLLNFDLVMNIIRSIQNLNPLMYRGGVGFANIVIWGLQGGPAETRNCGFMWEPGAYAAMLLIPIFIQLLSNDFKLEKKSIILIVALLTTVSTMGYLGLLLILAFYLFNKRTYSILIILPIAIGLLVFILSLDFMTKKILDEIKAQDEVAYKASSTDLSFTSLGRIGSLIADFNEWKNDPLIGIGGHDEAMFSINGKVINRTNGLSKFFLKFGIIGLIVFFYGIYKSFYYISKYRKNLTALVILLLIVILSFSNELLTKPLFFAFSIMYIVDPIRTPIDFTLIQSGRFNR